ncbi:hypothetical protein AAG906_006029 [Vitis piasezkii]
MPQMLRLCFGSAPPHESSTSETLQPSTSDESSLVGPRGKRDIKSLYDATIPIELQYSGLCLLGEEEPSNFEEAKVDPILVAKGYVQRQGIDFDEVFAPVARLETEVYVIQPPGFEIKGEEHKVLKLHKALYGLRQAPRAWNSKLDKSLRTLGFERCSLEHAVYMRNQGKGNLIVGVYVDDLIITGECIQDIDKFKSQMKKLFSMSDLGLLSYYLGIEVCQNSQRITLNQLAYARKVLDKCGMKDCNPSQIPMEPRLKLSKESTSPPIDTTLHQVLLALKIPSHTPVGILCRHGE